MDASSEFRVSIGIAYAYLKQTLEEEETDFTLFELRELERAYDRITERKQTLLNKVTQESLKASKDEKLAEMLSVDSVRITWVNRRKHISSLRRDLAILHKVDDALKDRTVLLMGISKRRFTERTSVYQD